MMALTEPPRALLLNGGSSSGKTTLARCLQTVLDGYWLRLGVDTLIEAAPPKLFTEGGLDLAPDGQVGVGEDFIELENQWMTGVAAIVRAGGRVIVEENFVSGPRAQERWRRAFGAVSVAWVGVHCPAEVATRREAARRDRIAGMAAFQAEAVHRGIEYDLEVDTSDGGYDKLAVLIRTHFFEATT
jgi:chloramphenicol 3-O phosphotransferase